MTGYLVDSNILINSNRYYRQQYFPVVWHFFQQMPNFHMLDRVYQELTSKSDDLSVWTRQYYLRNTVKVDDCVAEYGQIAQYVSQSGLWSAAGYEEWTMKAEKADPWLIASAMKHSYTIITDEKNTGPHGNRTANEPKIPFVAQHFNVSIVNFWDFLSDNHFVAK